MNFGFLLKQKIGQELGIVEIATQAAINFTCKVSIAKEVQRNDKTRPSSRKPYGKTQLGSK
jgi:hypothetical protein